MFLKETAKGLAELIERGGIYGDVEGNNPKEALSSLVKLIPASPSLSGDKFLEAALEREALMSTSIGGGIALPHPRNPVALSESDEFVALAFLKKPVDWNSLDGEKVDTLFLLVSSGAKQHLKALSEITYLCRRNDFSALLKERSPPEKLLGFIRDAEKKWS